MKPEATYLQHLESIKRIARFVARRAHLNADETDEFVQIVCVRLFEHDYAIIRKYEGRSSFTTYLTTVILRLQHQDRVEHWGKWRPSAEAKRLGDHAINLERLLTRDGYTFDEAVNILTTHAGSPYRIEELKAIYFRLPPRNPRPMIVPNDDLPEVAVEPEAHRNVEAHERECADRKAAAVLDEAISKFGPEDRIILQLRFWRGMKVPEIARILSLEQKKLYKRLEKLLLSLRRALEAAGVISADHEIDLDLPPDEEK